MSVITLTTSLIKKIENFLFLLAYYPYKITKKNISYKFQNKNYKYLYSQYNRSWFNERTVEIPIFLDLIQKYKHEEVLEIGNVLSHYIDVKHDVVDKYEKAKGVINKDIVDFNNAKKYKLIISISTLEHVGWDEEPKDNKKILKAIINMKRLLTPNGNIIITIPLGYNQNIDKLIEFKKINFSKNFFLKRITVDNEWRQIQRINTKDINFDKRYLRANILLIGFMRK